MSAHQAQFKAPDKPPRRHVGPQCQWASEASTWSPRWIVRRRLLAQRANGHPKAQKRTLLPHDF